MPHPLERLRHHVSGAIERGEKEAIMEVVAITHASLIGKRIEIPVHYDLWMRGARFGVVTAFRHGQPGQSDYVLVKIDHPQVKRRLKLWRGDWPYAKILD